ncbi:helix-turn-helix domain-containing protein [Streptomyces microflavus]|uniref:helix-turn-helix domain-containing protein n=1 Tax=Streptomyces microflavus TaxID=1919 RepID=UPI0037CFD82D
MTWAQLGRSPDSGGGFSAVARRYFGGVQRLNSGGELSSRVPGKDDLEQAKYAFARRLTSLRTQLGMSRRELAAKLGINAASIVDYENVNPRRRTPVPGHGFVLRLLDEVKRSTGERDVSPVAIEDTLTMYRNLLKLRVRVDQNSTYAQGVLEALEAELRLRANAEGLQAEKTDLNTKRRLREQGIPVPEEAIEEQERKVEHLESERPGLVVAVKEAERRLALIPDPDAPTHDSPPTPNPEIGPGRPTRRVGPLQEALPPGPFGPLQETQPAAPGASGSQAASWRYLIVGAVVVLLLGGFTIFRLTDDDSPTADRADSRPEQTATVPEPTPDTTKPDSATTAPPPTAEVQETPPPETEEPSVEPAASAELPEKKVFVYQDAQDVYVGYGSRAVDFDSKPPQQVGSSSSDAYDLHSLGSEGNAVVLSKKYDRTQLVQTPAGFKATYENCVALHIRETGKSNLPARVGNSFCLTTVKNRMVHFTVKQAKTDPSDRETQVVVDATVWENPSILDNDAG